MCATSLNPKCSFHPTFIWFNPIPILIPTHCSIDKDIGNQLSMATHATISGLISMLRNSYCPNEWDDARINDMMHNSQLSVPIWLSILLYSIFNAMSWLRSDQSSSSIIKGIVSWFVGLSMPLPLASFQLFRHTWPEVGLWCVSLLKEI